MIATTLHHSPIIAVDMANSTKTTPSTTTSVSPGVDNGVGTNTSAIAPELNDFDYFVSVLQLPDGRTENQIEDDLVSKANALGISSAPVADNRITSSVESASTVYNARTFSMLSGGSTSTALTSHSSLFGPPTPDPAPSSGRQSKDLSFAQYDRYLSVIDPHHNHPKTSRQSFAPANSPPSIFSGKTKRSLFSVKSGLNKLRWKKKSPQPIQAVLCVVTQPSTVSILQDQSVLTIVIGPVCKAQFCYACGGLWDTTTGCPNNCGQQEEMERRRRDERARLAEYTEEKAVQEAAAAAASAERLEAEERTRNKENFSEMAKTQQREMVRFLEFFEHGREHMRSRFVEQRKATLKRHIDEEERMKEKHVKSVSQLEDRQVAAEMDLRNTLEASARSVNIRLKHMEAYCDGLGRNSGSSSPDSTGTQPHRVVTERDLRELGQQYNIRDGMERSHQAKINVMRDRQAKRMEELINRQETEYEDFLDRNREEFDELAAQAAREEEMLSSNFSARKAKLVRRWELAIEILRKELEAQDGVKYAPIPTPVWPEERAQIFISTK
ncbi:hypothetical protein FIE12Z_1130 [Fusarium flagelliforme]|uniref:Uncharacterized protein n=1 Tax=Fusarium flagelliforme TaxID=2675880 RepID=A0A395N3A0_9HYPO|nr:hypothetical protein FIE12Z_1130 [Fusarium flagelliforme]